MAFTGKTTRGSRAEQLGLAAGVPTEALRQMLGTLVQETIEQEFTRFLGAGPHERTTRRRGYRNGSARGATQRGSGVWTCGFPGITLASFRSRSLRGMSEVRRPSSPRSSRCMCKGSRPGRSRASWRRSAGACVRVGGECRRAEAR